MKLKRPALFWKLAASGLLPSSSSVQPSLRRPNMRPMSTAIPTKVSSCTRSSVGWRATLRQARHASTRTCAATPGAARRRAAARPPRCPADAATAHAAR